MSIFSFSWQISILVRDVLQDNPFRHETNMENTLESSINPQHKKVFTMFYRVEHVSCYTH